MGPEEIEIIVKEFQVELTDLLKKYQEKCHAGAILTHGLDIMMFYTFLIANDKKQAHEMIDAILKFQLDTSLSIQENDVVNSKSV